MIFRNMHVRPYNCHIKKTDISNLKMANDLVEILIDRLTNKEIPILFDNPKSQRPC